MGTGTYLLDKEHMPIYPDFEENTLVMDENEPSSVQAQEKKEKPRTVKAAKIPTIDEVSQYFLKSKQDQLGYFIASTLMIEKGLATLTQNQESLERIIEQKFYALDVKVIEIQLQLSNFRRKWRRRRASLLQKLLLECPVDRDLLQCQSQILELQHQL